MQQLICSCRGSRGWGKTANVLLAVPHRKGHLKWFCSSLAGTWQPRRAEEQTAVKESEERKKDRALKRWETQQWQPLLKSFNRKSFSPFLCSPAPSAQRAGADCCQLDPPEGPFFQLGQADANSGKTYPGCWIFTFAFLKPKLNFYLVWVMIQKIKYARITVVRKSSRNGFLAQTYASHISLEVVSHGNLTSEGHWS